MLRRVLLSMCVLMVSGPLTAVADELILESGERIRGKVEKSNDGYTITLEDGEVRTYAKDKVKRWVYHSAVTPTQALRMLEELQELVLPYLTAAEPEQFQWLAKIRLTSSEYEYYSEGGRLAVRRNAGFESGGYSWSDTLYGSSTHHVSGGSSSTERRDTAERELKIDQVFANEWKRHTDRFDVLADNARYKELVTRRKGENSLGDFAMNAPDEYKDVSDAINRALRALEDVFEEADASNAKVRARIFQEIKLEDEIMKARNRLEEAKDKANIAKGRQKKRAQSKRDKAEAKLNDLVRNKETKLAKLQFTATEGMAEFAKQEAIALNGIQHAIELLRGQYEQTATQ